MEHFVQKVPKWAEIRDFQVLAVRNTDFWEAVETLYIIHG